MKRPFFEPVFGGPPVRNVLKHEFESELYLLVKIDFGTLVPTR